MPATPALANGLPAEWVRVDLDWAAAWPESSLSPDLSILEEAMAFARQHHLAVLLSLTHAPPWALGAEGPSAAAAQTLLRQALTAYGDVVQAVELFPAANTVTGWGASPDPEAYLSLYRQIAAALSTADRNVPLVALGLTPTITSADMPDLAYLDAFLSQPEAQHVALIGLRLTDIRTEPVAPASGGRSPSLRHYEQVRAQLQYHHHPAMLWLTEIRVNNDIISCSQYPSWLEAALRQMQFQMYLEAAFFFPPACPSDRPGQQVPGWPKRVPKTGIVKPVHATHPAPTPAMEHSLPGDLYRLPGDQPGAHPQAVLTPPLHSHTHGHCPAPPSHDRFPGHRPHSASV